MFVSTSTPCRVAMPVLGPSRLDTVARWKVVKKWVPSHSTWLANRARRLLGQQNPLSCTDISCMAGLQEGEAQA